MSPGEALPSYAVSFHEVGRVLAKYVQRILTGVKPQDLPVEGIDEDRSRHQSQGRQAGRPDDPARMCWLERTRSIK